MATDAGARAAELGLPPVAPASELHRAMLAAATAFGHPGGWPAIEGQAAARQEAERLAMVLSSDIREPVSAIVAACHRVPEEVLGPSEMRAALERQAVGDG